MLRNHFLSAVVVVLLLVGWVGSAAPAQGRVAGLKRFQSRHYLIHADLPRKRVVAIGRHMDAIFDEYSRRFAQFQASDNGIAMNLYLLRSQEAYQQLLTSHNINATNTGGMFFVNNADQGLATWVGGRSQSQILTFLQHEGFHQFVWSYLSRDMPVWMNEGLVQYFEDGIMVNDNMNLGLANAHRIDLVRHALENRQDFSFNRILHLTGEQWADIVRNKPQQAAVMYAQAWSMVFFLIHGEGGRYYGNLKTYLKLLGQRQTSDAALAVAFKHNLLLSLDNSWRRYARQQRPDAINMAAVRLEFLGMALRYLHENDEAMPTTVSMLRQDLQARKFTVTRQSHGMVTKLSAMDNTLYEFTRHRSSLGDVGRSYFFEFLEPARNDLSPRITAPGLRPRPTLIWSRDDQGKLIAEILYR
jgi:hypothetical protein